jgi:hypothetical protein
MLKKFIYTLILYTQVLLGFLYIQATGAKEET